MASILPQLTFFQAEPFIKNSHLISQLFVYKNEEIILFGQRSIFIYSLKQMLKNHAALVNIIDYAKMYLLYHHQKDRLTNLQTTKNKYHIDQISLIFDKNSNNKANKDKSSEFGQKIFSNVNDISSNLLLKTQPFIERLMYLNEFRSKQISISPHGDILMHFWNGKAMLIKVNNRFQYYKKFTVIDINAEVKAKIEHSGFVKGTNNFLYYFEQNKIHFYDYLSEKQVFVIKVNTLAKFNEIKSYLIERKNEKNSKSSGSEAKHILMLKYPHKIQFFEIVQKKKLSYLGQFQLEKQFIQSVYIYQRKALIYITTAISIFKINFVQVLEGFSQEKQLSIPIKISRSKSKQSKKSINISLKKVQMMVKGQLISQFSLQCPQQVLYIDSQGSYITKQTNSLKQYFSQICQTTNGFYVGLTCKKQGNYKEGGIIIGLRVNSLEKIIERCCEQICDLKQWQCVNFDDLNVLTLIPKVRKQILSTLQELFKEKFAIFNDLTDKQGGEQFLKIFDMRMSQSQFERLFINLGNIFQGKESIKSRLIDKILLNHYNKSIKQKKEDNSKKSQDNQAFWIDKQRGLKDLCIFSHVQILNERIFQCKICNVYGGVLSKSDAIQNETNNMRQIDYRNGSRRCYICLNQMSQVLN